MNPPGYIDLLCIFGRVLDAPEAHGFPWAKIVLHITHITIDMVLVVLLVLHQIPLILMEKVNHLFPIYIQEHPNTCFNT